MGVTQRTVDEPTTNPRCPLSCWMTRQKLWKSTPVLQSTPWPDEELCCTVVGIFPRFNDTNNGTSDVDVKDSFGLRNCVTGFCTELENSEWNVVQNLQTEWRTKSEGRRFRKTCKIFSEMFFTRHGKTPSKLLFLVSLIVSATVFSHGLVSTHSDWTPGCPAPVITTHALVLLFLLSFLAVETFKEFVCLLYFTSQILVKKAGNKTWKLKWHETGISFPRFVSG